MQRNHKFPTLRWLRLLLLVSLTIVSTSHGSTYFGSKSKADFLVSDNSGNQVFRFRDDGTRFADPFIAPAAGGLAGASGMVFDGNGDLLVASRDTNQVLRFNGATGAFLNVFADSSDGILGPTHIGFLPGKDTLLVANFGSDVGGTFINGTSITAIDSDGSRVFTKDEASGMELQQVVSFVFGLNNDLFVSDLSGRINKYRADGDFIGEFASVPVSAAGLAIASNGDLLVANPGPPGFVRRFNASGTSVNVFSTAIAPPPNDEFSFPVFVIPSPLDNNELLVSLAGGGGVYRFSENGGLIAPFLIGPILPDGTMILSGEILYIPTAIPEPTMALPFGIAIGYILMRRRRGTA